ncbi:hypothetical protein GGR58DRAFT_501654 [Xylaria digitata]|nr:hypothetical protein GGR58DRAFT_501654 [Xylaria digitata]
MKITISAIVIPIALASPSASAVLNTRPNIVGIVNETENKDIPKARPYSPQNAVAKIDIKAYHMNAAEKCNKEELHEYGV